MSLSIAELKEAIEQLPIDIPQKEFPASVPV
jgi:hypothetical protein